MKQPEKKKVTFNAEEKSHDNVDATYLDPQGFLVFLLHWTKKNLNN